IVFGQNNHIAWGGTNMEADLQDLVMEQIHPEDPTLYRYQQQWLPFTERTEYIKVKSDFPSLLKPTYRDVELKIKETLTGPVISKAGLPQAVSLRWTALQAKDTTYEGFFHINHAQNWQQFKQAADKIASPSLNCFTQISKITLVLPARVIFRFGSVAQVFYRLNEALREMYGKGSFLRMRCQVNLIHHAVTSSMPTIEMWHRVILTIFLPALRILPVQSALSSY
ncbi:hypothetical protein AC626_25685, partial [Pseudoalteromonas rubra]